MRNPLKLTMANSMPHVLLVEDDRYLANECKSWFVDAGFDVTHATSASHGWERFVENPDVFDVVVTDMALPPGKAFNDAESRAGFLAGLALARRIHRENPRVHIIGVTRDPDQKATDWFKINHFPLLPKSHTFERQLLDHAMVVMSTRPPRNCFIVHGHDTAAINELKDFIEREMPGYNSIVLADYKGSGAVVIEKLEQYIEDTFLVFVLMTPDDQTVSNNNGAIESRARQNVIFELGYCIAKLGRLSGRIVILTKGKLDLPTDISGMITIDISDGISVRAKDEILREVRTTAGDFLP